VSCRLRVGPLHGWRPTAVSSPFTVPTRTEKVLAWLADELRRQRSKCPTGPRIAATLESLDGFESGVTLVFADARTHFGILAILRTADLGPFTSSEITHPDVGLGRAL
jgi:hypothetical protein